VEALITHCHKGQALIDAGYKPEMKGPGQENLQKSCNSRSAAKSSPDRARSSFQVLGHDGSPINKPDEIEAWAQASSEMKDPYYGKTQRPSASRSRGPHETIRLSSHRARWRSGHAQPLRLLAAREALGEVSSGYSRARPPSKGAGVVAADRSTQYGRYGGICKNSTTLAVSF